MKKENDIHVILAQKILIIGRKLHMFLRIPALFFTLMLVLLSTAGLTTQPTVLQIFLFLVAGVNFHIFAFVLNDYIDLPIDKTQTLRSNDPLVQGIIAPWLALVVALVQFPIALIVTFFATNNYFAFLVLGISFFFMSIYDIWGKRSFFPPLTDLSQGLAWAMLVLYIAIMLQHDGRIPTITWIVFAFIIVFVVMGNGVHGSLRDINNDQRHHRRTTAIFFGARPGERGIIIPLPMKIYALSLQALLISLLLVPLSNNSFHYDQSTRQFITSAIEIIIFLSLAWPLWSVRSKRDTSQLIFAGVLHLGLSLIGLLVICAPLLQLKILALLIILYFLPLLSVRLLRQRITRLFKLTRSF